MIVYNEGIIHIGKNILHKLSPLACLDVESKDVSCSESAQKDVVFFQHTLAFI